MSENDTKYWTNRIGMMTKFREKKEQGWRENIDAYKGLFYSGDSDIDRVTVPLTFGTVRTMLPALYFRNPDIVIYPRNPDADEMAPIFEQVMNYYKRELKLKQAMKRSVLDAIFSYGVVKVGHVTKLDIVSKKKGEKVVYNEFIQENSPFVVRISPFDFIWDFSAPLFRDSRWCAQRIIKPFLDVKDSKLYDTKDLKPTRKLDENRFGRAKEADEEEEGVSVLWEIHDRKTDEIITIAEGHEKLLRKDKDTSSIQGFNFSVLTFNDVPDEAFPISDVAMVSDQNKELNWLRTFFLNHIKRNPTKWLYPKGALEDEDLDKLVDPEDMSIVGVSDPSALVRRDPPPIPREIYEANEIIKEDVREGTGVSEYQRGAMPETKRTLGEAEIIESHVRLRSGEKLDSVGEFATEIIEKLGQTILEFWDKDKTFKITGEEGPEWRTFTEEEIKREYGYEIIFGSTAPLDEARQRNDAVAVYKLFQNDPNVPNKKRLILEVLKSFDIKEPEELLRPEAEPETAAFQVGAPRAGAGVAMPGAGAGQQQAVIQTAERIARGEL